MEGIASYSVMDIVALKSHNVSSFTEGFSREDAYSAVALGFALLAMVLLITCTISIFCAIFSSRTEEASNEVRKKPVVDIPPTYSQIVMRNEPPEYHESLMQEINPESNPEWSPNVVSAEVRETIAAKVRSQAHGMRCNNASLFGFAGESLDAANGEATEMLPAGSQLSAFPVLFVV